MGTETPHPTPAPPPCHRLTLGARNWEDLLTTHFGKEPGEQGGAAGSGTPSIPPVPKNQDPHTCDPHSTLSGHMSLEREQASIHTGLCSCRGQKQ